MNSILIVAVLLIVFLLFNLVIVISVKQLFSNSYIPAVGLNISIIVAAKNEEKNIPLLIRSVKNLDYPKDKFEVIIADDNSVDGTYSVADKLISGENNFRLYKVGNKILPGKKGALSFGIGRSRSEHILITDSDCRPEPRWLKIFAGMFGHGYDFIFGIAPFTQNKNLVNKLSCFENMRGWLLTLTAAKLGLPYSAAARNFGFKKSSFEKIKGYTNTSETLSGDDDLLLREAYKNHLKIGVAASRDSFVFSFAKENFKDYFLQKSRHVKTSLHYLFRHKVLLGFWHILNLILLFSFIPGFFHPVYLILFAVKLFIDAAAVSLTQQKFTYHFNFAEMIYLQILYEVFLIINFLGAIARKDRWK